MVIYGSIINDTKHFVLLCFFKMLSDFLFVAPHDQISKLLVAEDIPVYMYVLNTTVTSIPLPDWRMYSHDTEYYFLTGAPFMDNGKFSSYDPEFLLLFIKSCCF